MCSPDLQDFSACRSRTTNLCDGKTCSWEGLGAVCSPKLWLEAKTLVLKVKWLNLIPCQESNSSNNSTKTNIICIRFRSVEMFCSSLWIGNGVTALPFPQQSFKDHGLLVAMSVCYLSSARPPAYQQYCSTPKPRSTPLQRTNSERFVSMGPHANLWAGRGLWKPGGEREKRLPALICMMGVNEAALGAYSQLNHACWLNFCFS